MTGAPSPLFVPCEGCGRSAALPSSFAGSDYCPKCAARSATYDAAEEALKAALSPAVGAWASFWTAAGLSVDDLEGVASSLDYSWANPNYATQKRRAHLRRLRRAYPLPPVEAVDVRPVRQAADFEALPLLTAFYPEDPRPGASPSPVFADSAGQIVCPYAGLDTLALALPDGVRAVLYTGREGAPLPALPLSYDPVGFRVPAHLWEAFARYMEGREALASLPPFAILPGEEKGPA